MSNFMEYKGYYTKIECSIEDKILYGQIEGIRDLVTFECETIAEAETAFHEAVDDYLEFCEKVGKEPDKTYSGVFNVRINPELHRAAAMAADREGKKLNTFVREAIQDKVEGKGKNEIHLHVNMPKQEKYNVAELQSFSRREMNVSAS